MINPAADSFHVWLRTRIQRSFSRCGPNVPVIFWCDPQREWQQLLRLTAVGSGFQLWDDEVHELALRERLYRSTPGPRVVWLPSPRAELEFCEVFALQAADVCELTLAKALDEYGVDLPNDDLRELQPLLASYVEERFDYPQSSWKDLTLSHAESTLVDAATILEYLAAPGRELRTLEQQGQFALFARIASRDFGLPRPALEETGQWRAKALATLLCTEAADRSPETPPAEGERIIPPGPARANALGLLDEWLKRIDLIDQFEKLAPEAEAQTGLRYWARNRDVTAPALSSPTVEGVLFAAETDHLAGIEDFKSLARTLADRRADYEQHANAFWGKRATKRVCWSELARFAGHAEVLQRTADAQRNWSSPAEAARWYLEVGWHSDEAAEDLFREEPDLPGALVSVRARLQKAALRLLDAINSEFSECLAQGGLNLGLQRAGDVIREQAEGASAKCPVAVLVLDACRYELGCRLARLLNEGEPATRAEVQAAVAPLPSITDLGMAFSLPGKTSQISAKVESRNWVVTAEGFAGNLSQAANRREWLRQRFKLKERSILSVDEVLSQTAEPLSVKALGRLIFVFGAELDTDGHEGRLKLTGSDEHLDRYAKVIRKLRTAGYPLILVVTDHGFFHWRPEKDEVQQKPAGDLLWESRRAVVGLGLRSPTGLPLTVTGSELECMVPRSVNAFQTYGGLGYFHGGATLQELVIPVLTVSYPRKAQKIAAVLKPLERIERMLQKIEVAPGSIQQELGGGVDETHVSRSVLVKAVDPATSKTLFRSKPAKLEPGGETVALPLEKVPGAQAKFGTELKLQLLDADDDELLESVAVRLSMDMDDWD
jgi:hypothetical protein